MENRKLEITLHSAKDLYDVKFFGTMDPYAMVWIDGKSKVKVVPKPSKTPVAKKGGPCPLWNCLMKFDVVPMRNNHILFVKINHDGKLFDRDIGEVQVPLADLLAGDASGKKVSYPVKTTFGEVHGEIILSHKFSESIVKPGKKDDGSGSSKVARTPRKKQQRKKKDGSVKRVLKDVGKELATEAVLLAGTVGIVYGTDALLQHGSGSQYEDCYDNEDLDEDDDDVEDEDEDEGEDEDEDEDEYEDEDEDEDEYEDEDEDEDEDEYEDEDDY